MKAYDLIRNKSWPVIMLGDLNMDPQNPVGNNLVGAEKRLLETAALLSSWGLKPMADHFHHCSQRIAWTAMDMDTNLE